MSRERLHRWSAERAFMVNARRSNKLSGHHKDFLDRQIERIDWGMSDLTGNLHDRKMRYFNRFTTRK